MYDIIIIGAGPAGLTACLYASRAGAQVLVLESGAPGGKLNVSAEVENWPGIKKVSGPELAYQMYEHAFSFGGTHTYGEVAHVQHNIDHQEITTTDGKKYQGKLVLIASGTKERKMHLDNEDRLTGKGISYCAVCDGPFFKNQEVAVIGGGNSALEEADYLTKFVSKVHIIVRRDVFRADEIVQKKILQNDKIQVHFLRKPHHIIGETRVEGIGIEDSKTGAIEEIAVRAIFPFIGLDPITHFVMDLGITDTRGYIETNDKMQTKVAGIYAAGDVRQKDLRQVVTATNDGAIAGQEMAVSLKN